MYWRYVVLNRFVEEKTGVLYGSRKEILLNCRVRILTLFLYIQTFLKHRLFLSSRKFNAKQMSVLFRDFANMLESGLTINPYF